MLVEGVMIYVSCDTGTHAPGDSTALTSQFANTREEALTFATRRGWTIGAAGTHRCPFHTDLATDLTNPGNIHYRIAELARRRLGGEDSESIIAQATGWLVESLAGLRDDIDVIQNRKGGIDLHPRDAVLLGRLEILRLSRVADRIVAPQGNPPMGQPEDLMLSGRRDPPGFLAKCMMDHLRDDTSRNVIRNWFSYRTVEWHIMSPDIWASTFWHYKPSLADPVIEAAMSRFAEPVIEHILSSHSSSRRKLRTGL